MLGKWQLNYNSHMLLCKCFRHKTSNHSIIEAIKVWTKLWFHFHHNSVCLWTTWMLFMKRCLFYLPFNFPFIMFHTLQLPLSLFSTTLNFLKKYFSIKWQIDFLENKVVFSVIAGTNYSSRCSNLRQLGIGQKLFYFQWGA